MSRTSSLEEDDKSTDSILCRNLLRGNDDDDTAVEDRGKEKRLPGIRYVNYPLRSLFPVQRIFEIIEAHLDCGCCYFTSVCTVA